MKEERESINSNSDEHIDLYKSIVDASPIGYAILKIIVDDDITPCDYEFLTVNAAFEVATGLVRKELLGKRVSDLSFETVNNEFDLFQFYR